ncbi:MAG: helix-turn-helix domain-containing protein [Bradyrhizobium sp.]|uniref:helix-turn-helix domain-containing protein n=1 Tax=Bradyrhizobium sp. TaxID=376 RepID=UPI0027183311|nr:helix-turn-helix domain-containing protein [Bradyrhizobium sp.]MDO8398000.1 helix-turn-helix domain-containing protein [Bradyrhizobium sp.]
MDDSPAAPSRIVFSSNQLGEDLGDEARFLRWREIYTSLYGDAEIKRLEDRPFSSHAEFMQIGEIGIAQCAGTFGRYARTKRHVAGDTRGDFFIGFLRGHSRMALAQHGRELTLQPGELAFYSNAESYQNTPEGPSISAGLCIPRALLLERIGNAEDMFVKPLDATQPAVRHLRRYMDFVLASDEVAADPLLTKQVSATLIDLAVLALGAGGEVAEMAQARGLRAARRQQVVAEIAAGFADPAFSPQVIAAKLGVSPRYLQKLLHETGASFSERVLELRLQCACGMLASRQHDDLKISDIAGRSGFNDISHFNHCFRRRFGASPTEYRRGL